MAEQKQQIKGANLVSENKVIATIAPIYGAVELQRGEMGVSDRFGRSVAAVVARVPLDRTGFKLAVTVYGRLDDKTGKITYAPSIPRVLAGDSDTKDKLKGHIVSAIKVWPEWAKVRAMADHACRFGKVKVGKVKADDGSETELETSLESEPEPADAAKTA